MRERGIPPAFQAVIGSFGGVPTNFLRSLVCLASLLSIAAADPERVPLWSDKAPNGEGTFSPSTANITVFQPERLGGATMIICPGDSKDPQTHLIDLGPIQFETAEGRHPTAAGHKSIYQAALPHFDRLLCKAAR